MEKKAYLGAPRWSADGRYLAAIVSGEWPKNANAVMGIVIAEAGGRPLRVLTSPYVISMFAWAPSGQRLAYTTSGFPDPHELFVVDGPTARPRPLFTTGARHFDWITWSPDGRFLLLDDENRNSWRLVRATSSRKPLALPRLGGRPLWCCPVNAYATRNG
jgi:Tol biopolymer transport system component